MPTRLPREAERKAQEVIFAAEAKAAEIIQRATAAEWAARAKNASDQAEEAAITEHDGQQAGAITPQAQAQVPPEAIATLSAAIGESAETNRTLSAELVKLRLALGESSAAVPEGQQFTLKVLPSHRTVRTEQCYCPPADSGSRPRRRPIISSVLGDTAAAATQGLGGSEKIP